MRENNRLFDHLRSEYPDGLSKEQFYKIAHISKATARYLLQSGKVPCKRTGKKTHCYLIQIEDVIFYLQDRKAHPVKLVLFLLCCPRRERLPRLHRRQNPAFLNRYLATDGWYSAKSKDEKDFISYRQELRVFSQKQIKNLRAHINMQTNDACDLLNIKMISTVTGYSCSSICKWCKSGRLRSFKIYGAYSVPREWLVDFLTSEYANGIMRKSKRHLELIREFLEKESI